MKIMDYFRSKSPKNKKAEIERQAILDAHNQMITDIQHFDMGFPVQRLGDSYSIISQAVNENGERIGITKITKYADPEKKPKYEFLIYEGLDTEGRMTTQYYEAIPSNKASNPDELSSFTLKYNSYNDGQGIPCETIIRANVARGQIIPTTPNDISSPIDIDTSSCIPSEADIAHIISEYARIEHIKTNTQTTISAFDNINGR